MKSLLLLVGICLWQPAHAASTSQCTDARGLAAEAATDTLTSWQTIYSVYERYHSCDDGGVAEGYSNGVVHLLATHWNKLPTLDALAKKHPPFREFVLSHIDATADTDELQEIVAFSKSQCRPSLTTLCKAIGRAAASAVQE